MRVYEMTPTELATFVVENLQEKFPDAEIFIEENMGKGLPIVSMSRQLVNEKGHQIRSSCRWNVPDIENPKEYFLARFVELMSDIPEGCKLDQERA